MSNLIQARVVRHRPQNRQCRKNTSVKIDEPCVTLISGATLCDSFFKDVCQAFIAVSFILDAHSLTSGEFEWNACMHVAELTGALRLLRCLIIVLIHTASRSAL